MAYKIGTFVLIILMMTSCGQKKKTMTGEEDVNLQEFMNFFPETTLPFFYGDTSLYQKAPDSLLISWEIFHEFTPDSILKASFINSKPKLYAIGKFKEKEGATYLMLKATDAKQKILLLTAYNNKNEFLAGFAAIKSKKNKGVSISITIDNRYHINKKTVKKLSNGIEISGEDVYVLNGAIKKFMLIMTDSLGDDAPLINPVDTLGRKYKYAADYGKGNQNIISIRDHIKAGRVNFFIHLEDEKLQCQGELKGEAMIISDNVIEYRRPGDPCVLRFIFDNKSVILKEIKGCGSRMGALNCAFDGRYPKKKNIKKH